MESEWGLHMANQRKRRTVAVEPKSWAAVVVLLAEAESAADWLCAAHEGTDQWERGMALREAIRNVTGERALAEGSR